MERKSFYFTEGQLVATLTTLQCIVEATERPETVLGVFLLTQDMATHTEPLGAGQIKISLPDTGIKVLADYMQTYLDFVIKANMGDAARIDAQLLLMALNKAA